MKKVLIALAFAASSIAALTGIVVAKDEPKDALPPGSVSRAKGLEAWKRIEAVVTHPRCANCHVDARGHSDVDAGRRNQAPGAWHEYPWRKEPHRGRDDPPARPVI